MKEHKKTNNVQEKLQDAIRNTPSGDQNQEHNSRKEGLGPNTKR